MLQNTHVHQDQPTGSQQPNQAPVVVVSAAGPETWWTRLRYRLRSPFSPVRKIVLIILTLLLLAAIGIFLYLQFWPAPQQVAPPTKKAPEKSATTPAPAVSDKPEPTPPATPPAAAPTPKASTPSASSSGGSSAGSSGSSGGSSSGGSPCPLPAYPSASCTGVPSGTTLATVSGDLHITVAGSIVENKDIDGCVFVQAPNVTIRKTKINCGFAFGIHALDGDYSGGGLLIQDVEIDCGGNSNTAVAGYGYTAERVNIHGCENGFAIDHDATVKDSYIHDFYHGPGAHTDGIQWTGGSNVTIRHNYIYNNDDSGTSAIIGDEATATNILITENLLDGGGYSVYCNIDPSPGYIITNNHFGRNYGYAPWVYCSSAAQHTGNVWHDTGLPVPL